MIKGQSTKVARICAICNESFLAHPSAIEHYGARFCSRDCYHRSRLVPLAMRFAGYVGGTNERGCLLWTGDTNRDGYGVIGSGTRKGRMLLAHRVAWTLANGTIPDGLCVLHSCDSPPCVNVDHLFLGTQAVNMADKKAKGRMHKRKPGSRRWLRDQRRGG